MKCSGCSKWLPPKLQVRTDAGLNWSSCRLLRLKITYDAQGREGKLSTGDPHDDHLLICEYAGIYYDYYCKIGQIFSFQILLSGYCASNGQQLKVGEAATSRLRQRLDHSPGNLMRESYTFQLNHRHKKV